VLNGEEGWGRLLQSGWKAIRDLGDVGLLGVADAGTSTWEFEGKTEMHYHGEETKDENT
jgi:hypothetical protein